MTLSTLTRSGAALLLLAVLGACSTSNGPGNPFGNAPSAAEYARMDAESREAAAQQVQQGVAAKNDWWQNVGLPIYLSGEPVQIGNKQTGRTLMWDKFALVTYIYAGHTNGGGGLEQNSTQSFRTSPDGNILLDNGQLLANVATQEGLGRFAARIGVQLAAPVFSGVAAAKIHTDAACKSNCGGGDLTQIAVNALSNAEAIGTGNATASSGRGVCTTCGAFKEE